jgi:hypothetical protein
LITRLNNKATKKQSRGFVLVRFIVSVSTLESSPSLPRSGGEGRGEEVPYILTEAARNYLTSLFETAPHPTPLPALRGEAVIRVGNPQFTSHPILPGFVALLLCCKSNCEFWFNSRIRILPTSNCGVRSGIGAPFFFSSAHTLA